MKDTSRITFISIAAAASMFAASARAAYLCDAPRHPIDKRACEAAEQGPEALRHFIDRVRPLFSLDFSDYVNEARRFAWDARDREFIDAAKYKTAASSAEPR